MEENVQGEVQGQEAEQPKIDEATLLQKVNQLQDQLETLQSNKARILEESKDYKSKYQSLRGKIEQTERQELESKEKWKELLEREREEKAQIMSQHKNLKGDVIKQKIHLEVAKLAENAKPAYLDDIVNNLNLSQDNIDVEKLEVKGIAEALDDVKKRKPDFFNNGVPGMNQKMPDYKEPKEKTLEEAVRENPMDILGKSIEQLLNK